jgi:histidine triad (HIT) family protein
MTAHGCVFCAIVASEADASIVYDDEDIVAFMDLQPVTPGHLLVVLRRHIVGLSDLDDNLGAMVWKVAQQHAAALRLSELQCEGVNLFVADGEAAFQEIFHFHLHVFPASPATTSASTPTGEHATAASLTGRLPQSAKAGINWSTRLLPRTLTGPT